MQNILFHSMVPADYCQRRLPFTSSGTERSSFGNAIFDWAVRLYGSKRNETHVRQTLKCWVGHYNRARPHSSLWTRNTGSEFAKGKNCKPCGIGFRKIAESQPRGNFLQAIFVM